jgi:alpha-glucosidase
MRSITRILFALMAIFTPVPPIAAQEASAPLTVDSPDGRLRLMFRLDPQGRPTFDVSYRQKEIVAGSLGLEFVHGGTIREGLKIVDQRRQAHDETYSMAVGKTSKSRDHHNELIVSLEETTPTGRKLDLAFRAFDDGVAFLGPLKLGQVPPLY